jgi:hypothetical protein
MTPEIIIVSDNDFSPKMFKADALTRFYSALYGRANCGDFTNPRKIFPSSYATGVNQSSGLLCAFSCIATKWSLCEITAFVLNRPLTLTKVTV